MIVIPIDTVLAGVEVACLVTGVVELTKATGFAPTAGDKAYFNATSGEVEGTDAADNFLCGVFAQDAATGAVLCEVRFDGRAIPDSDADIEAKANKVAPAAASNLAGLTVGGDLEDSGVTSDMVAALTGAAAPDAGNVFATMADVGGALTVDELAAINGAAAPAAGNVFATMADLPANELTVDQQAALDGNIGLDGANTVMGITDVQAQISADTENSGSVASASFLLDGLPTADDTVSVGGVAFTAKVLRSTDGEFTIGVDEDTTLANLAAEINYPTAGGPNLLAVALGSGTKAMVEQYANAPGGSLVVGFPGSVALAASITPASTGVWAISNLNDSAFATPSKKIASGGFPFDATSAGQVQAGFVCIGCVPWTPTGDELLVINVQDSSGIPKVIDDSIEFDDTYNVLKAVGQGGSASLADGDTVQWMIFG